MAQARRGGKIQSKLGFLIYGDKGTWKSSLAAQLGDMVNENGEPMRVLYIDTENGSIDDLLNYKASEGIDVSNIYVVYSTSLEEVKEIITQAKDCNENRPISIFDSQTSSNYNLENDDGTALVLHIRQSACSGDCHKCSGCGAVQEKMLISAKNPIGASVGDMVTISASSKSVLLSAAVLYVIPVILFFVGYFLGMRFSLAKELLGCGAFALGIVFAIVYSYSSVSNV